MGLAGLIACQQPLDPPAYGNLSGYVLDQVTGEPISGAEVLAVINQASEFTDSLGVFFLDSLSVGSDTFRVSADYYDTQYTILNVDEESQETTFWLDGADTQSSISFRSFFFRRAYFEDVQTTRLLVFTSSEEQDAFMDSAPRMSSFFPSFASYEDSIMVGMIYGAEVSVSETFQIDSITVTTYPSAMTVYASLLQTIGKLALYANPSHFVVLPKMRADSIKNQVIIRSEQADGEILFFRTYTRGHHHFISTSAEPSLIVLSNQLEEAAFLDTTTLFSSFEFPTFGYGDSMLVGVIMNQEFTNLPIDIVSLVKSQTILIVDAQRFLGFGVLPDPGYPSHFVVAPLFASTSESLNIQYIYNHLIEPE